MNATSGQAGRRLRRRSAAVGARGSATGSARRRRASGGCVSGRRRIATRPLTKAMPAATKNGTRGPPSAARPPSAGPSDEADAERGREQSEQAGPLARAGDVGDRALRHGHAGAGRAVDDAADEQHPQRPWPPR